MYCLQWKERHPGVRKEHGPGQTVPNQGTGGLCPLDFRIAVMCDCHAMVYKGGRMGHLHGLGGVFITDTIYTCLGLVTKSILRFRQLHYVLKFLQPVRYLLPAQGTQPHHQLLMSQRCGFVPSPLLLVPL